MHKLPLTVAILLAADAGAPAKPLFGKPPGNHPVPVYARAELPPLLEFLDGRKVTSNADWQKRREEIRSLLIKYFIGTFPAVKPEIIETSETGRELHDDGSTRLRIRLTLATPNRAAFQMALWVPKGKGPFPLLLTAPRFYQRYWAEDALARGYAVCLFPGVDSHHRETDYPGYDSVWETIRREYPKATWTEISTKGWLASRCIDYLLGDQSVAKIAAGKIAIIGFSRYGKAAMIAGAFDQRITCVVARSPGSPAYFTLDGMFRQRLVKEATELILNHLENYNYHAKWKIPVAPEAYKRDLTLFGDQYSNFNAGKILLYLEGLAGLKYSLPGQQLTIRPALPQAWEWMEVRLPIAGQWTKIRYTGNDVEVTDCPLRWDYPNDTRGKGKRAG